MKYGFFDDSAREYVITTPRTPFPWINYLGNDGFFGLVSNTAGGYSFYRDATYRRITRYRYNNIPTDEGGRYYFIKDGDTVWNPGWAPSRTELDSYECRHGLGYTRISSAKNGIEAQLTLLVPLETKAEVHALRLTNTTNTPRTLGLASFAEFALWNAQDDTTNFQRNLSTGEVEVEVNGQGSAVYHRTEYRERRNHYSYLWANFQADSFDTDRASFVGQYNHLGDPQALAGQGFGEKKSSVANGWSPIASLQKELTLKPGESRDFVFVLGYVEVPEAEKFESTIPAGQTLPEGFWMSGLGTTDRHVVNKAPAREVQNRFSQDGAVQKAFDELASFWKGLLETYQATTPEEQTNRMVNIWNQYQCMVTYNLARSASYFESGIGRGLGFRDTNQDLLGFVHQIPQRARERILDVAATQFEDGGCYHQFQPLTKKGNNAIGGNFHDDPLWLILSVSAYVKETGDWSILDESVPFDHKPETAAPLFDHLVRSWEHVINNRGPHDLPLIGRADWNDCLNLNCFSKEPNESFQTTGDGTGKVAESLFIAGLFCYAAPELEELAKRRGDTTLADQVAKSRRAMEKAIEASGWDGQWFLRAYDAQGNPVGSRQNKEGKIFIESQGICGMARVGAESKFPRQALDSVRAWLNTPYGIVLQQPAYSQYYLELGEISTYPPGYKENAGIFCHNNPWIMIAEALEGRGDRVFEYYKAICPAYLEDQSEIRKLEPYVYAQMVAGKDAPSHGEAKNSWLTGTAAWNFVVVSQHILGVQPHFDGLRFAPILPSHWNTASISRVFRGVRYNISVTKAKTSWESGKTPTGTLCSLTVDGKSLAVDDTREQYPLPWALLPLGKEGQTVEVVAEVR